MKGAPIYKKKGEITPGVKIDQTKLVTVTSSKDGRVFYQNLDGTEKSTSSSTSFRQKYELCGFVD